MSNTAQIYKNQSLRIIISNCLEKHSYPLSTTETPNIFIEIFLWLNANPQHYISILQKTLSINNFYHPKKFGMNILFEEGRCPRDYSHQKTIKDKKGNSRCAETDYISIDDNFEEEITRYVDNPTTTTDFLSQTPIILHQAELPPQKEERGDEKYEYNYGFYRQFEVKCYAHLYKPGKILPLETIINRYFFLEHDIRINEYKKRIIVDNQGTNHIDNTSPLIEKSSDIISKDLVVLSYNWLMQTPSQIPPVYEIANPIFADEP